jgi:hypothetical protein
MNSPHYINNTSSSTTNVPELEQSPARVDDTIVLERVDRWRPPQFVPAPEPARERSRSVPSALIVLAILIIGLFLNTFRTMEAIDLKSDESTYAIESVSMARTGMTRWNGGPFLVHPPLFFLIEGVYYKLAGVGEGPLFTRLIGGHYTAGEPLLPADVQVTDDSMPRAIEMGRYLNALYGAVLAAIIFLFGRTLMDTRLGLLAATLFLLDPYVVWRNHFNYLEGLTTIFGMLAIILYYKAEQRVEQRGRIRGLAAAGLFLGLALLTKELALLFVVAILVYWLMFRRNRPLETGIPIGIGLAIYMIFPLWTALNGEFQNWWETRQWLVQRLMGQIRDSGVATDRPGTSFLDTLALNVPDYWPWFVILGLAFVLAIWFIYRYFRHGLRDRAGEYLAASIIGTYGFFVVIRLMGGVINEHFFYYLMPFATVMPAYVALTALTKREGRRTNGESRQPSALGLRPRSGPLSDRFGPAHILLGILIALVVYNAGAWIARYGFSRDNSYVEVEGQLANTLPAGTLVVGRDLLDLYLLPKQGVYTFSYLNLIGKFIDPANIRERRIPYALLNDQSVQQRYGGANPVYYEWVQENADEILTFKGRLYKTAVYEMDYTRPEQGFNPDNLAARRPVVVSSAENPSVFAPENAVDTLITTRWASKETDNEWIYVDLGSSTSISRVILSWEDAFARSYQLQVSDDAQNWRTFYSTSTGAGSLETIDSPATGRYVRVLMTQRGTDYGYSLWEISIYP